jgi:Protein of unknown function (DUF3562)
LLEGCGMVQSSHGFRAPDDAAVAALARKTQTPIDVVRHIYDEELADLDSKSAVKNFIEVIAGRRVRNRLLRLASETVRAPQ